MATLYALLVGIGNSTPRHQLYGCVRDQQAVKEYLQQVGAGSGMKLEMHELLNEAATREALIWAFSLFDRAGDGDICLFSFSGHSSRNDAPEDFWHLEPDRLNESLVLWDSRAEGGLDLLDKELSYLIWKATNGKNLQFVALMDCCHSGSGTLNSEEARARMAEKGNDVRAIEEMLGYEAYKKDGAGKLSPLRGCHILLAGARDNQTAKGLTLGGATRGVFTFSLLEVLRQYGNQLTYSELVNHLCIRLAQRVKEQSPQLEVVGGGNPKLFFLSNTRTSGRPAFLVAYNGEKGWHVNAGAFHGINGADAASSTELELESDGRKLRVTEVDPAFAIVEGLAADEAPENIYRAVVTKWGSGGIKLAFAPGADTTPQPVIREKLQRANDGLLQLTNDPAEARYHIDTSEQALRLVVPGEQYPLFQRVPGYGQEACTEFLKRAGMVARWVQMVELANPRSTIKDEEVKIEIFRLAEAGKLTDTDPEVKENWKEPVHFRYFFENGVWIQLALQFKITNTGRRPLWVSALYLTSNFGVFNQLLPKQELVPGEEAWLLDIAFGVPHRSILLQMEEAYHRWGINQISDFLKVLVCTEEFDTDAFNQEGLPLKDRSGGMRGFAHWEDLSQSDWLSCEIELRVVRPFARVILRNGMQVYVQELGVQVHKGFVAKAMLNTLQEAVAALQVPFAPQHEGKDEFSPLEFSPAQQGVQDLCVLECWDVEGQVLDSARPLRLQFPEGCVPYHCDSGKRAFAEAGSSMGGRLSPFGGMAAGNAFGLRWPEKNAQGVFSLAIVQGVTS